MKTLKLISLFAFVTALAAACATSPENLTKDNMTLVSQRVVLDAPIDKAWEMLHALGDSQSYDPVVEKSQLLTEQQEGVNNLLASCSNEGQRVPTDAGGEFSQEDGTVFVDDVPS